MTFLIKGVVTIAKKRLKKKQQAKKNIELLNRVGITNKRQVKELKNKPKEVHKVYKKESRNILARERYGELTNKYNVSHKQAMSMRYWGEKRYNEFIASKNKEIEVIRKKEEKRRKDLERKNKNANDLYLLMFWREKTDQGISADMITEYKTMYRDASVEWLLQSIYGFLTVKKLPVSIGTYQLALQRGKDVNKYKSFMRAFDTGMLSDMYEWVTVYEGKAQRYKELLLAIHAMIRNMYDIDERSGFIGDLITKYLPQINKNTARRLAKDLKWRDF